jgi:glycosyltransferase involved in cell wall biosynthesis
MSAAAPEISVVLPTLNRLTALRANFPSVQALAGVGEIVVVVDGSTDGTLEWLQGLDDPRVKVISQAQRGSPAARNAGIEEASGRWILMTEDDCLLPREFALTLREVAREQDAQVVGAPWLHVGGVEQMAAAYEQGRRHAQATIRLGTLPSVFPAGDLETPFLNGVVLVAREVFDVVRYDESFRGNAWREETSLFLRVLEAGFRCVLTPRTAAFQIGQWSGGQRRPRASYELWAFRNNWRFLRAHRATLERLGEIHDPLTAQLAFAAGRLSALGRGYIGTRWQRLTRGRGGRRRAIEDVR